MRVRDYSPLFDDAGTARAVTTYIIPSSDGLKEDNGLKEVKKSHPWHVIRVGALIGGIIAGIVVFYALSTPPTFELAASSCIALNFPVLSGSDVVDYHSLEPTANATVGDPFIKSIYNSYIFYFSTEENMALFEADPTRYLPQWGGFCAYAIANEDWKTWDDVEEGKGLFTNPDIWTITDDKLYFFQGIAPLEMFVSNSSHLEDYIAKGDDRWEEWVHGVDYFNTNCFWWNANSGPGMTK